MTGVERIAAERQRQVEKEGWTADHDDEHGEGELATAAACYAAPERTYVERRSIQGPHFVDPWPWSPHWDKRYTDEGGNVVQAPESFPVDQRIDMLTKAGALIAAEIDRLLRTNPDPAAQGGEGPSD